jgi:aquaporin Z
MTAREALGSHWPEYLIEGWALGTFMIAAGIVATLLGSPVSPVSTVIADAMLRNVTAGIAMGLTAIALIHSPWGKRSGAHMNPAVTLTFLRLKKIHGWDAVFFIIAQTFGGTAGRSIPADTQADDLWYWQINMRVAAPESVVSAGTTPLHDGVLGWSAGVITHDPDGHASLIARDRDATAK